MTSTNSNQLINDLIGDLPPEIQIKILKGALDRAVASQESMIATLKERDIQISLPPELEGIDWRVLFVQKTRDYLRRVRGAEIAAEPELPNLKLDQILMEIQEGGNSLPDFDTFPTIEHQSEIETRIAVLEALQSPRLGKLEQSCLNLGLSDTLLMLGCILSCGEATRQEGFAVLDRSLDLLEQVFIIAGIDNVKALITLSDEADLKLSYLAYLSGNSLEIAKRHYPSRYQFIEGLKIGQFPPQRSRKTSYFATRVSTTQLTAFFINHYRDLP